jgi:hypothetical protein
MMWLASTGNVILAKGFLRYLWLAQPGTLSEKRNLASENRDLGSDMRNLGVEKRNQVVPPRDTLR